MNFLKKIPVGIFAVLLFLLCAVPVLASSGAGEESGIVEHINGLVIQLGLIIFTAWAFGQLFRFLRFPAVLGEVMAGVIIGPYCLGKIPFPGFAHGLFPLAGSFPVTVELYGLATIASIVLLFLVGLETDLDTFLRFSFVGSMVGIFGVIVSFILGDIVGIIFAHHVLGAEQGFFHPVSLFFGVISTATSVGITARILSEKKRMNSPDGVTILAAAVIDDILGIVILAIVIGMAQTHHVGWKHVGFLALKTIGIWLGFTVIGLAGAFRLSRFLKKFKSHTTIALMSFAMALLVAGIFEKSGLAMIIGAYTMGLTLSKTDISFLIQEKMETLQEFFVPIFFCVMGMLINVESLTDPKILFFGFIYIVFAVVGKLLGCSIPALFCNFNLRGAMHVGLGMIPRGEVALIVAGVGISKGIIDHDTFSMAIIMTFVTTLITPPILNRMLDSKEEVLRKPQPDTSDSKTISFDIPNVYTGDFIHKKVLEAFTNEGFHVHRREHGLYLIRGNRVFITMKYTDKLLEFVCAAQDEEFIYVLLYEVIAEMEGFMSHLQSMSDKFDIGKKIFTSHQNAGKKVPGCFKKMSPLAIEMDLKGQNKDEIIKELAALLFRSGQLKPRQLKQIIEDLLEREQSMSTGMQDGIALPHAKTDAISESLFALGIKKGGVDFASLDNQPSRIFVLILSPKANAQEYLQCMSEITKFLADPKVIEKILSFTSNRKLTMFLKGQI